MNSKESKAIIQDIKMMPAFAAYRNLGCTACVNGKKIWVLANPLYPALLETLLNRTVCKTIYIFIRWIQHVPAFPFEEEFKVVYTFSNFISN